MPRRQPMNLVEAFILLTILAILFSIAAPALQQAGRRASTSPQVAQTLPPEAFDGRFNAIDVSELSPSGEPSINQRWLVALINLLPILVIIAILALVIGRARKSINPRA